MVVSGSVGLIIFMMIMLGRQVCKPQFDCVCSVGAQQATVNFRQMCPEVPVHRLPPVSDKYSLVAYLLYFISLVKLSITSQIILFVVKNDG